MESIKLPFKMHEGDIDHDHGDSSYECGLFRTLPPALQEACRHSSQLMEYLHMMPMEETGVPQYLQTLSKKTAEVKNRNFLYPAGDDVVIHVWSGGDEERTMYIPIEPNLFIDVTDKMEAIEKRLIHYASTFAFAETKEERKEALTAAIMDICNITKDAGPLEKPEKGGKAKTGKIDITPREFQALKYVILKEKVGMGALESFMQDPYIEDISCSGLGHIYIEHKIFKSMKAAVYFAEHDELDKFVLRLSEQIKRPVTMRKPIVDAMLPDGSRINIVYGQEVSVRGSNFTIRKFSDIPISIMELIEFGTLDYHMASYLSLMLESGMNVFVAGETASGKTTLLNAITAFVDSDAKIVSIEDTPEVNVPHPNWIREVAKAAQLEAGVAGVSMMDLLKAALRQRPNLIIIGEIRGEEGAIAFQAMQTGHAVMATFHASSVEKLIQRLTGVPINIPKTYIDNLNIVIIQSSVKLPNGKTARRVMSISEIVGYDPPSNSFSVVEVFHWDPSADTHEFTGDKNSYLLEEKLAPAYGFTGANKWGIYSLLEKRANVLRKLHQGKGITGYYELLKVLARAKKEGLF